MSDAQSLAQATAHTARLKKLLKARDIEIGTLKEENKELKKNQKKSTKKPPQKAE